MSDINWETVQVSVNGQAVPIWLVCAILGGAILLVLAIVTVVVSAITAKWRG